MTDIAAILDSLQAKYDVETDANYLSLYSKMSVIEFCGWIEVTFDDIWNQYIDRVITKDDVKKHLKEIVEKNYGFDYKKNIQSAFCSIIGGKNWEVLLDNLDRNKPNSSVQLKSILNDFTTRRNSYAHTTIGLPITRTYDSPSIAINNYRNLYPIISLIEQHISTL